LVRTLIAWAVAAVLLIVGLVPFVVADARVLAPPLSRLYAPLVLLLPPWSAALLAASLATAFVLVGHAAGFVRTARPLLIVVAAAWVFDATGFWRVILPVDQLIEAQSVGDMFRLTAQNLREDWQIGGSLVGWIMLVMIVSLAVGLEIVLSRKQAR
jgi:hypothetical protein